MTAYPLTDDELVVILTEQLPSLLERRPDLEPRLYLTLLKTFARREEVAAVLVELREFRAETREEFKAIDQRFERVDQRFEQIDKRFESLETRMGAGFQAMQQAIDRLGQRWGIQNESLFRQTMKTVLADSFGAQVTERRIGGEQFDVVIFDGQHILVEIAASAGPKIQERLERKRQLYRQETGIEPARVILATASIHSQRAQALRAAGFEVIEPEEEALEK